MSALGSWEDDAEFHLVMPAALGGDVFEMLQAHGRMTEEALKFYVSQPLTPQLTSRLASHTRMLRERPLGSNAPSGE